MSKNSILKIMMLVSLTTLLAGCSLSFSTGTSSPSQAGATDGGVYKSTNQGASWEQKVSIQGVGQTRTFASVDIIALAMDPADNKAIYAASRDYGLFYSYDAGDSWKIATTLGKITVKAVAVDPANKCTVYAASANKVFKSSDCSRSWSAAYFDNDLELSVNTLAVDPADSRNVYLGTSRGEVIKSMDGGGSWRVLDRFDSQVVKVVISPANVKNIFAGTLSRGVYRSTDGGGKWDSLDANLKTFDDSRRFRDLVVAGGAKPTVFLATNYGLLKSADNGNAWSKIELLTPETEAVINALAVNPNNLNEIYYATNTTFYRSLDGGKNWSSKKLPTNRAGSALLIDPKNTKTIYLSAAKKIR